MKKQVTTKKLVLNATKIRELVLDKNVVGGRPDKSDNSCSCNCGGAGGSGPT